MLRLVNLVRNQSVRSKSASRQMSRLNLLYQSRLGVGASKGGDFDKMTREKSQLERERENLEEERRKMRAALARCQC